jgi:hypothetical protein
MFPPFARWLQSMAKGGYFYAKGKTKKSGQPMSLQSGTS